MKCLAFSDLFIPQDAMQQGLARLARQGIEVTVRTWQHANIEKLQEDNLKVEQHGAAAVSLPNRLIEDIDQYELIITQFAPLSSALIKQATRLKYIGVLRGGTENVDVEAARAQGITVYNTPGRNARSVAEFTVGMILAETRNIARSHRDMFAKRWDKHFPNGAAIPEIGGKTIGIVGFGHIGQLVARFLRAFDVHIIFYDKYISQPTDYEQVQSLAELVKRADVLTVHARHCAETHHLIDRALLQQMKPSAVIINTARSGLIDEQALLCALREHRLMGAAIDTFDDEPLPSDSPFYQLDNVTITPHLAGSTLDAFTNTPKLFAEQFLAKINQGKTDI